MRLPGSLGGHLVMRRGLVFVIGRFLIIPPHRMILKAVPHEDPAEIRMPLKYYPVKIKDLTLLKLAPLPDPRDGAAVEGDAFATA